MLALRLPSPTALGALLSSPHSWPTARADWSLVKLAAQPAAQFTPQDNRFTKPRFNHQDFKSSKLRNYKMRVMAVLLTFIQVNIKLVYNLINISSSSLSRLVKTIDVHAVDKCGCAASILLS